MGLIYVKRPNRSFIYFHLVRPWCATGRHPGGFTRWLRPCPGWPTRFLCLRTKQRSISSGRQSSRMSPSPARNTGWQHPASCSTNLLQHLHRHMYRFMYKVCTQGKKNKSAKTAFTSQSHIILSFVFFNCVFSLCILWNLASRTRGARGTEFQIQE